MKRGRRAFLFGASSLGGLLSMRALADPQVPANGIMVSRGPQISTNQSNYTPPFTNAVARTPVSKISDVVSVKDFGAAGDGVTDDTTAFTRAVATGLPVYVPGVTSPGTHFYKLTDEIALNSGQTIYGDGWSSMVKQTGATTKNVFKATSKNEVVVRDLQLYATSARADVLDGNGVIFNGCTNSTVLDCYLLNPGSSGVQFYNCSGCVAEGNFCLPGAGTVPVQEVDFFIRGNSSYNRLTNNFCLSNGDSALAVQTWNASDVATNNVIEGNTVHTYSRYGVYLYKTNIGDTIKDNQVIGNNIRNITGSSFDTPGVLQYGTGIYNQTAENTLISGNLIDTCCVNTNSLGLSPSGITSLDGSNVNIVGNIVRNSSRGGIVVGNPTTANAETNGIAIVANNLLTTIAAVGIRLVEKGRCSVTGNTLDAITSNGIQVANPITGPLAAVHIGNNTVRNSGGSGVLVQYVADLSVVGNHVIGQTTNGIFVSNTTNLLMVGNYCSNGSSAVGSEGINVGSTVTSGLIDGNYVTANQYGIEVDSTGVRLGTNYTTGNTNEYFGAGPWQLLTNNSTTPSIKNGTTFLSTNSNPTTYTTFLDGYDGQDVWVRATNGNSTFKFSGVTNLKGNAGVDLAAAANDGVHCVYEASVGAWFCTIFKAS